MNTPISSQADPLAQPPEKLAVPEILWSNRDILYIITGIGLTFSLGILVIAGFAHLMNNQAILERQPSLLLSLLAGLLEIVALLSGVYYCGIRRLGYNWRQFFGSPLRPRWFWISLLCSLVMIIATGVISGFVEKAVGNPMENPMLDFLAPEGFHWVNFLGVLLVAGIMAPVAEEIFFRGVLFRWLRGRCSFWSAAIVSSAIFGLLHGELSLAAAALIMGIVLAYLYEKSQSLWSPVLIHILNNSVKIIILYGLLASRPGL